MIDDDLEFKALTQMFITAAEIGADVHSSAADCIPQATSVRTAMATLIAEKGRALAAIGDAASGIIRFGSGTTSALD